VAGEGGLLLAFFGKSTAAADITTARVGDYRLHRMGVKSRRGRLLSATTINREYQVLRGALRMALEREDRDAGAYRHPGAAHVPLLSDAGGLEAKGEVLCCAHDIDTAFRCTVKRVGLDTTELAQRVTFHTLRHSFASLYAQRTGDLLKLQKMLGRSSYGTTEKVYAQFSPDYVVGATAALEGVGAQKPTAINARSTHGPVKASAVQTAKVEALTQVCDTPTSRQERGAVAKW